MNDTDKMIAILNLKVNATLKLAHTTAQMIAKVNMKPDRFTDFKNDLKQSADELDSEITRIMNLSSSEEWYVVDHDNEVTIAGPFSTANDAGTARGIIERYTKTDRNLWVQQKEVE